MLVSSANITGFSTEDAFLRPLTYYKKSSGPDMEHCGALHLIRQYSVLQFSST